MSLGGFRMMWQPLRPFIAGTKLTNYVLMKHGQEEEEKEKRPLKNAKMIHVDAALSPPATPVHLSSPVSLVASSPSLTSSTVTSSVPLLSTPDIEYDGITFTANVANLFSVAPTSPPESDYDDTEVSLFMDEEEELEKMKMAAQPSPSGRHSSLSSTDGYIDSDLAEAAIEAVRAEPSLATAVSSVLETGSMTPLIKEELKCTIQTKRMKSGKGELKVPSARKKVEELTPEEEAKRMRRRERNKAAAQKCRDKKSARANELQEEIGSLESRNTGLRTEMKHLSKEIEQLRNMLVRHDKSTQCGHSFQAAIIKLADTESISSEELGLPAAKRQKTKRGAQKHHE